MPNRSASHSKTAPKSRPASVARKPAAPKQEADPPQAPASTPPPIATAEAQLRGLTDQRQFDASGDGIVWAVVGSGIDGAHPHFRRHENLTPAPGLHHRDFTFTGADDASQELEALIDRHGSGTHDAGLIGGELTESRELSLRLRRRVQFIGGAPGADTEEVALPAISGVAPRTKLLSLRVIDDNGAGRASAVIAALRWVQEINDFGRRIRIHGVNLGLAYDYDVELFACGASPMCVEVNNLVKSGVIVVTAAGNGGINPTERWAGSMTITDPGNAEAAITVGATNGPYAHAYGVSYFSAKGPTLDGRAKPDLVAPGERCASCVPPSRTTGGAKDDPHVARYDERTGTAPAAAYTSGVVAALLSVRRDLIGQPMKVKELLLLTAEDLHRDRYGQGYGLVSLARALYGNAVVSVAQPAVQSRGASPGVALAPVSTASGASGEPLPASAAPAPSSVSSPPDTMPVTTASTSGPGATPAPPRARRFSIGLSYAGESIKYVKKVVFELRHSGLSRDEIFFDKFYDAELLTGDLDAKLIDFYGRQSELVVVFASKEYAAKDWTGVEWRVAKDLIKRKEGRRVMVLRFDETELPGWLSIDVYLDLRNVDPEEVAEKILERLEVIRKLTKEG